MIQAEKQAQAQAQAQAVAAARNPGLPDMQQAGKWGYAQLQYPMAPGTDRVLYASNQAPNTSSTNDLYASTTCTLRIPLCTRLAPLATARCSSPARDCLRNRGCRWANNPGLPNALQGSAGLATQATPQQQAHQLQQLTPQEHNAWAAPGVVLKAGHSPGHHGHNQTSHGHVMHVPMHQPPQYTNTIVREAVPGNTNAAHCSLQTDICGATWPLHQPFPMPAQPQSAVYHMQQGGYAMVAASPGLWDGMSSTYGSGLLPMGVHFSGPPASDAGPHTLTQMSANPSSAQTNCAMAMSVGGGDTAAAAAPSGALPLASHTIAGGSGLGGAYPSDVAGMQRLKVEPTAGPDLMSDIKMEQGGGTDCMAGLPLPPSPPSSPPPELVDMLFDFDKFDDLEDLESFDAGGTGMADGGGADGTSGAGGFGDMDDMLAMGGADVTDTSELFKIFTPDVHGMPTMTTHLHQRMASEASGDMPWGLDYDGAAAVGGGGAGSMASGQSADYADGDGMTSAKRARVDDGSALLSPHLKRHMAA